MSYSPVVVDRALQALVRAALEPERDARFEPKSYVFRPGRGCHDAIGAIYATLNGQNPSRVWVLDADLTAAFDRVAHHQLLTELGGFPARDLMVESPDWSTVVGSLRPRTAPRKAG